MVDVKRGQIVRMAAPELGVFLEQPLLHIEAEGLGLIERAVAAKPDNGPVVDSLGWALVRSGRAAEGLPHLERAWQLTEDAEVASHLGTALWLVGRRDEAYELWNRVLKEHPDNRHLLAALAAHPRP